MLRKIARSFTTLVLGVVTLFGCTALQAQQPCPMDVTVTAVVLPATLCTFQTPNVAAPNQETVAKIVTNANGVSFTILTSATFTNVDFQPNGQGQSINNSTTLASVATAVADQVGTTTGGLAILRVKVVYVPSFAGDPQPWTLKVKAGAGEYWGFVVTNTNNLVPPADSVENLVTIAKLSVNLASLNFGDVQINIPSGNAQIPILAFTLKNLGTDTLQISSLTISSAAYTCPKCPVLPIQLSPGQSINPNPPPPQHPGVPIDFNPTCLGDGTTAPQCQPGPLVPNKATMTITSNDPASPQSVAFTGNGVTMDAILLLDVSPSMTWLPDGTQNAPELQSRLWAAKQASNALYQEYNDLTSGKAKFGLYAFPDPTVADPLPTTQERVPLQEARQAMGQVTGALGLIPSGGLGVGNGTPIAEGIKHAQAALPDGSISNERPVILLFTDGAHNIDSAPPFPKPDDWISTNPPTPLMQKAIRIFTVGYGTPGSSDVDHALLQRLADATKGVNWAADSTDFANPPKAFRNAVRTWLNLNDVADPRSTISAGQQKTHAVCIDDGARAIVFVTDWDTNQQDAIAFTLTSPQGVTITPDTPGAPNVSVFRSDKYTMYVVKGDLVRLGAGAGQWTLNLTGSPQISGTLNYAYNVQVQSFLNIEPTFPNVLVTNLQPFQIKIPLDFLTPQQRSQAKVTLNYRAPKQSFNNWLSKSKVDPAWIIGSGYKIPPVPKATVPQPQAATAGGQPHAPDTIMGEPATLTQKKAWALANIAKTPFPNQFTQETIDFQDNGSGVFVAQAPTIQYDGLYHIDINILPATIGPACFQRSFTFNSIATVALTTPRLTGATQWQSVQPSPFFDDEVNALLKTPVPPGMVRRMVVTTPRDQLGNYFGTGNGQSIKFQLREAKPIGRLQDLLGGNYAQIVEYSKRAKPQATVTVGNVTSNSTRPGPRCPFFHWLWYLFGGR